jgi:hypothetical protein
VQVPPPDEPVPPPQLLPPPPQSHAHGGQVSPGAQAGQLQAQVPPPLPPLGGGGQSHCTAGQSASAGHAKGRRQAHPPPEASRMWQYPATPQSPPTGQSVTPFAAFAGADQAQRGSAVHPASVTRPTHGSGVTQTPAGHEAPAGHADAPTSTHEQALALSPRQVVASACVAQTSFTNDAVSGLSGGSSSPLPHPATNAVANSETTSPALRMPSITRKKRTGNKRRPGGPRRREAHSRF